MSLSLVTLCLALVADEPIAPEKAAGIERAQQKAQAEVSAKYGNKKPTELSREERSQMDKDLAAADRAVLEKNGVDPKQWARESLKKDRAGYAQNKEMVKALADKEKAAEDAKKAAATGPKEIEVQRGVSDENPVTLDEKPNEDGTVAVEKGLPPEAQQEQDLASGQDSTSATPAEEAPKAAKPGKGSRRR
ncbi:MAG: hypothetical protein Q8L48_26820 [Archangium sp.]|nr:hypothetical protein [Archangium sp.]